jgi:gliding motility-associated-like protein
VSPNGKCQEDLSIMRINADSTPPVIISCVNKELKPLEAGQTEFTVEENKYDPIVDDECKAYKVTYIVNGQNKEDSTLVGEKLPIGVNQIIWTATDSLGQKSNPCYCEFTVAYFIIPNYFTPNGDGYNDTWYFSMEKTPGATVKIYNQWGILVYDSKGKTLIDWDGRNTKGLECPADGYQYLISIGDKIIYKGTVTIIR